MSKNVELKIDGRKVKGEEGETLLSVARREGIDIPTLCHHPDLSPKANCRLCITEIAERKGFFTACSTPIESGMVVFTDSPALRAARKTILELLLGEHEKECPTCLKRGDCSILEYAKTYDALPNRFINRKSHYHPISFGPSIVYNPKKCIDFRNCVEVCQNQTINHLAIKERGHLFQVVPDDKNPCIYCGQCASHCPAEAIEIKSDLDRFEAVLSDKRKIVVVQIAPAVRVTIGEEFGFAPGENVLSLLVGSLREVGIEHIFDVSVGADFTTVEEVDELLDRLRNDKPMPMFTACCPAWVRYIELHHKSLLPNLTTTRSPHMILGGLIKSFWAKKQGIDPKNIVVVSIMPCTSKKYEIIREEQKLDEGWPVDLVLTTKELSALLKNREIDLKTCKKSEADNPLGIPTEAGVIYGASGGVMESALRSAYRKVTTKKTSPDKIFTSSLVFRYKDC